MDRPGAKFQHDPSSPSQKRANALALADAILIVDLVRLRSELGMSPEDVAEKLGISPADVRDFERAGSDPRLSDVRRYAHAVGIYVDHTLTVDTAGRDVDPETAHEDEIERKIAEHEMRIGQEEW